MARKSIEAPGVTSPEQAERLARLQAYRPLVIKTPEPDLEVRTYLVRRLGKPDDVLEGEGLYFRTRDRGGLIVFDRHGNSMATYEKGDWVSIEDRTR